MDIEEAASLLKIDSEVTSEKIDAAYKKLASKIHPDKGGDSDEMAKINKARDLLQDHISANNLPAVIKQFELTVKQMNLVAREQRALEKRVEKSEKEIFTSATNRLKSYKNIALVLAALSAAAIFLGKEIPKELTSGFIIEAVEAPKVVSEPVENELVKSVLIKISNTENKGNPELTAQESKALEQYRSDKKDYAEYRYLMDEYQFRKVKAKQSTLMWYAMTFGIGIYAAIGAWFFNRKIRRIEEEIEELLEDLSFKSHYASILINLFEEKPRNTWTFSDILEAVSSKGHSSHRLKSLVKEVGARKIAQLLINKGLESSVITVSHGNLDNRYEETYSLS